MRSFARERGSQSFLERVSLGDSPSARRCGSVFLAASVLLSPAILWRYAEIAVDDPFRLIDGFLFASCWLFIASEIRLFTAGRPVAFHWFLPEAGSVATLTRWLKFSVDVGLICLLASYLVSASA
jgi:hypothetical protein